MTVRRRCSTRARERAEAVSPCVSLRSGARPAASPACRQLGASLPARTCAFPRLTDSGQHRRHADPAALPPPPPWPLEPRPLLLLLRNGCLRVAVLADLCRTSAAQDASVQGGQRLCLHLGHVGESLPSPHAWERLHPERSRTVQVIIMAAPSRRPRLRWESRLRRATRWAQVWLQSSM